VSPCAPLSLRTAERYSEISMFDDSPEGFFDRLGRAVSSEWSAAGRKTSQLAGVAEKVLAASEIPEALTARTILTHAAGCEGLPAQTSLSDTFGQPPLVMYRESDFFVQALVWMEGSTAIHEHLFAGAFLVLDGKSLHAVQEFRQQGCLADDRIVVGDLSQRHPEILSRGQVRAIEPGDAFIHVLFHLERPTLTIVVRNDTCDLPRPQYRYQRPGLGWDGLWTDRSWVRRVQSVDSLAGFDPAAGWEVLRDLVHGGPLWEAFCLVTHWTTLHGWNEQSADLAQLLSARSAELGHVLPAALSEEAKIRNILVRRSMLHELHQRVFLALLANLPDPRDTAAVVQQLYPARSPGDLLLEWTEELSSPSLRGVSGLSFSTELLAQLRAQGTGGHEGEILEQIREAWGDPMQKFRDMFY
jgi:hypothetical protein